MNTNSIKLAILFFQSKKSTISLFFSFLGQLSLHPYGSSRRKSSFSNGSVSSYRTMPLSRTRSLLANINGVANGVPNGTNGTTNGTSSTANTPGSEVGNGYGALPSINGSSDHLPPLKASVASVVTANGTSAANNNKFYSNGTVTNGSNGHHNGYGLHDMDAVMASTVSSMTNVTSSLTNGHLAHLNGLQTLPHVRSSVNAQSANAGLRAQEAEAAAAGADLDGSEVNESESSQQPQSQQNVSQQVSSVSQNSVQQSPTNSSALSNNAVNSNNTGSLKPKTMVATPEQVRSHLFYLEALKRRVSCCHLRPFWSFA